MSTLSGITAKGEKGKSKFQSLDINNLYKASRGESLETHQHKNTQSRRHGMQTLGKIPSARRAPANLPSLKSEYSGNDPAISLVPSGGTGWGSKPGETGPPPSSTQVATSTTATPTVSSAATVAVTPTVSTVTPSVTPVSAPPPPPPTVAHGDKSWSSITSSTSETSPMFLAHQSPYFQQEFPSLSGDATGGGSNKGDSGNLPGPSLRPQTEGSWMQGGSRPQGQMVAGVGNQQGTVPVQGPLPLPHLPQGLDVGGGRNNLGPSGVGVGPAGPLPPAGIPPHHFRLMPQFMLRHNHPSGGFPPNFHGPPRFRFPYPPDTRMMPPNRGPPNNGDQDEHASRPIIKEEDLKVMDEIAKDTSWATHDEIDYNQTLTFSDDDGTKEDKRNQMSDKRDNAKKIQERDAEQIDLAEKANRENSREMIPPSQNERDVPKAWQQPRPPDFRHGGPPPAMGSFPPQPPRVTPHQGARQGEDDEVWRERRRLQNEEIAIAVERAKQRKEEEEKRYIETRQNAARKLQMLEEKMRSKTGVDKEDSSTALNLQQTSNALLPDWEKEKNRSRKNSEDKDDKSSKESLDHVKTQVDNRSGFNRERERERDREARPERDTTQGFSRMFQNNLPPRFQKQAADRPPYYRQGSGSSPQPSSAQASFDPRWTTGPQYGGSTVNVKQPRNDTSERDREDNKESLRDRDRNLTDMGYDNRERYNRPPSRDSKERNNENSWKAASFSEDSVGKLSSDNEHNYECDNRLHEKAQENEENKDKEKKYSFYEDSNVTSEKRNSENFKNMQLIQEDPFNHRDKMVATDGDRRDNLTKLDMKERPQRPDSRDSRASRESRNSRDSNREDKLFEESSFHESSIPWSDSTYDVENREDKHRKENREEREHRRDINAVHQQSYYQRHIPGPITKEKLEAAEKCESGKNMNLVPLVRGDKKPDTMKPINQWETPNSGGDAWQQVPGLSECWADNTSSLPAKSQPTPPHSPEVKDVNKAESQEKKVEHEDSNKPVSKPSFQEKEDTDSNQRPMLSSDSHRGDKGGSRGGNRGMRHDRGPRGWGGSYYRGAANPYRGDLRGRRSQNRRPREWGGHSESEASADEVSASTETGKEDKRHEQDRKNFSRSPKQGNRRVEKDDRPRDGRKQENEKDGYPGGNDNRRHDKRGMYDNTRMGSFEPRGEPSRRGRGAPFRSKGSANVGRRMDGYGPPTSKRPFTSDSNSNLRDEKKTDPSSLMQIVNKDDTYSKLSHDEKMKLNQQQLAAGIIGGARPEFKSQPQSMPPRLRRKSEGERRDRKPRDRGVQNCVKSGSGSGGEMDENWETTSETSEHEDREDDRRNDRRNFAGSNRGYPRRQPQPHRSNGGGKDGRRGNSFDRDCEHPSRMSGPPPLMNGSVRPGGGKVPTSNKDQQDSKSSDHSVEKNKNRFENKEKRNNLDKIDLCNTASVVVVDDQPEGTVEQDRTVFATDNNGFQEVRSKKNVKEANRQKDEPQKGSRERERERDRDRSKKSGGSQSPAQVPGTTVPANKGSYDRDRPRGGKLPPRFAKLRETNRLQKIAQQQTQDVHEINKINVGNVSSFPMKELANPPPPPPVNAWDKPINAALRTSTPPAPGPTISPLDEPCNIDTNEPDNSTASSQRSSPNGDKLLNKISREPAEKAVLDGSSPPVQTIIFENTNYKSVPGDVAMKSKYNTNHLAKPQRPDKPRDRKLEEENVTLGFKSPGPDMKLQDTKNDPIQMPMSFNKNEDNADMKLDFRFDSDLSQLTEDKTSKSMTSMQMTRSIQMASQSSAADLQFKLASVKKVWENSASVLEHGVVGGEDSSSVATATSFTPTFTNSVDDSATYGKPSDSSVPDDSTSITPENVYNPSQQMPNSANSYNGAGVNMMKPDPSSNVCKLIAPQVKPQPQAAMHPHGGPLSPPAGPFAGSTSQPGQHLSYQPQAQYGGMSAIPSPPTVFTAQPEIYQTFQINNPPQVLGSQGRSGFSQFASQGLGYISQGLGQTSGYSQQSLYHVQTGPPPTAAPPPPDVFQTQLSQYRIQPPGYGTSQQLNNNPSTVLISSSANSLMSASVKPSAQPPIGAIGTKAGSYQTASQPPHSQLYIYPDPQMLSQSPYLQSSQLVQRPANNVMQTIPPSSGSYYSATTGGGAGGYFQPGNSNMQAGPSLHQTTFSMQAFNTQSAAPTPTGMGSFGSQMAQPYRSTAPLPSYLKSADHQDHLSVFSSPSPVTQINPAKSRGIGGKQGPPQQQPSPTQSHHQFSSYQQNVSATTQFMIQQQQQQQQQRGNVSMRAAPRYPAPIQRPDSLPQGGRRLPNNNRAQAYKPPQPAPAPSQSAANVNYYVSQNDSSKLNSSDLDAKVDAVHSECEPTCVSSASNAKPADIAVEKSPAEN